MALVASLGSVLAGPALGPVGFEAGRRWQAGVTGRDGRFGELVDLRLELSDASGELDDERLEPGDGLALDEDDIDELLSGQREQCGPISRAARVANQVVERCTSVKFVSCL
ncbi:MAG: hypothetical protein U0821_20865 [Chloroflexota bacterium]